MQNLAILLKIGQFFAGVSSIESSTTVMPAATTSSMPTNTDIANSPITTIESPVVTTMTTDSSDTTGIKLNL